MLSTESPIRWLRRAAAVVISPDRRSDAWCEWRRRAAGEPSLPREDVRRVLVICQGNICRSPFAEALLARNPALEVRSAGLDAGEDAPAEAAAERAARRFGVDLSSHRAHRISAEDLARADLVLAMEGHQLARLQRDWPDAADKARLLGDFLAAPPHRIADPYGRSDAVFEETFARIEEAVARLARRLEGGA